MSDTERNTRWKARKPLPHRPVVARFGAFSEAVEL